MTYKTPGVYVKELSIFPPSVAEVESAIPAFVGYTEKAEKNGESLQNIPTRITSLLEYREIFGGPYTIPEVDVTVDETNNYAVTEIDISDCYYLFDSLRLFFDNGGGNCYIVSVGTYGDDIEVGDESDPAGSPGLRVGLKALEQYDEPTILLFPDAVKLGSEPEFFGLQQMALAQCNKLQDRFAVLDVNESIDDGWQDSIDNFRNGIGSNNLKYGAAYTPFLYTSYPKEVSFSMLRGNIEDSGGTLSDNSLLNLTSDPAINALVQSVFDAVADEDTYDTTVTAIQDTSSSINGGYTALRTTLLTGTAANAPANLTAVIAFIEDMISRAIDWKQDGTLFIGANLLQDLDAYASDSLARAIRNLIRLERNTSVLPLFNPARDDAAVVDIFDDTGMDVEATSWIGTDTVAGLTPPAPEKDYSDGAADDLEHAIAVVNDLNGIFNEILGFYDSMAAAVQNQLELAQDILYQNHPIIGNIVRQVEKRMAVIPPCGAIAGLYAFVDENRGVWKAPANVSVSSVQGPTQIIDDDGQEGLNVDPNAGKSINAIRSFTGKGTLVWGARTLAGNDNEWRYVPVRRFFNVVEESIKKATSFAVFEPNGPTTWSKVRSLISNYLFLKWKDGALLGATPEDAFFVKVGLGLTMTNDDILNGIMRVEIGMAVVRPAEFIILSFSHKLVEAA